MHYYVWFSQIQSHLWIVKGTLGNIDMLSGMYCVTSESTAIDTHNMYIRNSEGLQHSNSINTY